MSEFSNITIGDRIVGEGQPVFVIAEAGVNHNGDLSIAMELIEVAANAGADAVKFQTFIAENAITVNAAKADYQKVTTDAQESQLEMARRLELSFDDFRQLHSYCAERNILFLSTPFDFESVDFLEELGVVAYKVSSGDLTTHPLLEHIAHKGKPVILSTGMADLSEVEEAVTVVRNAGNGQLALLHCVTNYPAEPDDINLRAMHTMKNTFGVPVGYSDHTIGYEITLAAVALRAAIVEKHFTISREMPGPDHAASLEPDELTSMIRAVRNVERALGNGEKRPALSEASNALVARRSIIATRDIAAGSVISRDSLGLKRPGSGLAPRMLQEVVGHTARVDVKAGELLRLDMFE